MESLSYPNLTDHGTLNQTNYNLFDVMKSLSYPNLTDHGTLNQTNNVTVGPSSLPNAAMTSTVTSRDAVINAVYFIIGSCGFVGNLFVVVVIFSWTNMRQKATNMFIINQSCIDMTVAILLVASRASGTVNIRVLTTSVSDQIYCRLWKSHTWLFSLMMSSTYGVLALGVER